MINNIGQSFIASANVTNSNALNQSSKTEQTQKSENTKFSQIAEQIKNGTYKLDMKETAKAIAQNLL